MKVANLCDYCKNTIPTCENTKIVFGVDCKDILAYTQHGECDKKYLDAVCEKCGTLTRPSCQHFYDGEILCDDCYDNR